MIKMEKIKKQYMDMLDDAAKEVANYVSRKTAEGILVSEDARKSKMKKAMENGVSDFSMKIKTAKKAGEITQDEYKEIKNFMMKMKKEITNIAQSKALEIDTEAILKKHGGSIEKPIIEIIEEKIKKIEVPEDTKLQAKEWNKDGKHRIYINHLWKIKGGKEGRRATIGYFTVQRNEIVEFVEETPVNRYSAQTHRDIQKECQEIVC